jgi:uncharacterized protein YcbX
MQVSEINIYPVKSTRRIALSESEVSPRGLRWDRRWMLVDAEGCFVTARQYPALAVVDTAIAGRTLQVSAPGHAPLAVSLHVPATHSIAVTVWRDRCEALPVSAAADEWFSAYLGIACRLVHMSDAQVRPVDPDYGQPTDQVSFADGFPLLLISQASLDDLNRRLESPVSMQRFRPNLVVEGAEPYAEDGWRRLRVGEVEFQGVKNCSRCVFTTIDPDTGVKDPAKQPLRTLAGYRRREAGGVYFGQNLIPRGRGILRLGGRVEILERAD